MNFLVVLFLLASFEKVFLLDVVENKTGAEQVKAALSKAENESNIASKTQSTSVNANNSKPPATKTKNFLKAPTSAGDEKLDEMIESKVKQLDKLRKRQKETKNSDKNKSTIKTGDESDVDDGSTSEKDLTASLRKTENVEKENSDLEEASDQKMTNMAKKLNKLVAKFQNKIGHLESIEKKLKIDSTSSSDDDDSTKKITRGNPAIHTPAINLDVSALRRALGLIKSKELLNKNVDVTKGKASYKEDVKLEDKLALEAEEEKKVTNSDNYDDYSASEAAAGIDKSSIGSAGSTLNSVSSKDQASQEMQSYNDLISSESNRELSQIQDEINKATQSSMGKVSVVGQRENVQTESPSLPGIPGFGDAANIEGNGPTGALEGLLNGGGGGGGGDPLAAALAAGGQGGEMGDPTGAQATSINDLTGQQQQGGNDIASLNLGGGSNGAPIEVGSNAPVDMGMFGANNQQGSPGPENSEAGNFPQESSFVGRQRNAETMTGEQYPQQDMAYKKSKISSDKNKQKKSKVINKFIKSKNYKRTVTKQHHHHLHHHSKIPKE